MASSPLRILSPGLVGGMAGLPQSPGEAVPPSVVVVAASASVVVPSGLVVPPSVVVPGLPPSVLKYIRKPSKELALSVVRVTRNLGEEREEEAHLEAGWWMGSGGMSSSPGWPSA